MEDNIFKSHIPNLDLSLNTEMQTITDRETSIYLGHPDSIIFDNQKIVTVYPKGHGKGEIILKTSNDSGKTWSKRKSLPENFKDSKETPTIYKLESENFPLKVLLVSGNPYDIGGFKTAYSTDECETWTELKSFYDDLSLQTIVAHASLTKLKTKDGSDRWMGIFHDMQYNNYKTFLTFDENGNEHWSKPARLLEEHNEIEKMAELCEIEVVRSPDGNELALIARAQKKITNAMISFSTDEGETWTKPRELPRTLMGERHKACYNNDKSRLVITYRDILRNPHNDEKWLAGNFIAWVGTYDDLKNGNEGDYTVRLGNDYCPGRGGDCGYAGNIVTKDDIFVITTYGRWDKLNPEEAYITTFRLDLNYTDRLAWGL